MIRRYNHHDFVVSYPVNPLRTSRFFEYPSAIQRVKPSTDPNFQRRAHSSPLLKWNLRQASQVNILTPAFLQYSFQHRSTTYAHVPQNIYSLKVFQFKLCMHFTCFPCVLHVPPIWTYGLNVPTFCEVYIRGLITVQLPSTCCYLLPLSRAATDCTTFSNNVLPQERFFLLQSMHAYNEYQPISYSPPIWKYKEKTILLQRQHIPYLLA